MSYIDDVGLVKNYYSVIDSCQVPNLASIYEKYLGEVEGGTFVEVGAFDCFRWSNTVGLFARDWIGHYIEPCKYRCADCMKNFEQQSGNPIFNGHEIIMENINIHNLAISDVDGEQIKFYVNKPGQISTTDLRSAQAPGRFNMVDSMKLDSFLEKTKVKKGFEVLVIDVEGAELDVLNGFTISDWKPKLVIIEANEVRKEGKVHSSVKKTEEDSKNIVDYFLTDGYEKVFSDETNSIFYYGGDDE